MMIARIPPTERKMLSIQFHKYAKDLFILTYQYIECCQHTIDGDRMDSSTCLTFWLSVFYCVQPFFD